MGFIADYVHSFLLANCLTVFVFALLYGLWLLFRDYTRVLLFALLFSLALQSTKMQLIHILRTIRHESIGWSWKFIFKMIAILIIFLILIFIATEISPLWILIQCILIFLISLPMIISFKYGWSGEREIATMLTILFFFNGAFFFLFILGYQSIHEGISAYQDISSWIRQYLTSDDALLAWEQISDYTYWSFTNIINYLRKEFNGNMWWSIIDLFIFGNILSNDNNNQNNINNNDNMCFNTLDNTTENINAYLCNNDIIEENNDISNFFSNTTLRNSGIENEFILNMIETHKDLLVNGLNASFNNKEFSIETFISFLYNKTSPSEILSYTKTAGSTAAPILGILLQTFVFIITSFSFIIDIGYRGIIFFFAFYYLLKSDNVLLSTVPALIKMDNDSKRSRNALYMLMESVEGVILLPMKTGFIHSIITLFFFYIFGISYPFFAALIVFITSFFPIYHFALTYLPWLIEAIISGDVIHVIIIISINLILYIFDDMLYADIKFVKPFFTGISIFLGISLFGLDGALYGPLIVCLFVFILIYFDEIGKNHEHDDDDEEEEENELVEKIESFDEINLTNKIKKNLNKNNNLIRRKRSQSIELGLLGKNILNQEKNINDNDDNEDHLDIGRSLRRFSNTLHTFLSPKKLSKKKSSLTLINQNKANIDNIDKDEDNNDDDDDDDEMKSNKLLVKLQNAVYKTINEHKAKHKKTTSLMDIVSESVSDVKGAIDSIISPNKKIRKSYSADNIKNIVNEDNFQKNIIINNENDNNLFINDMKKDNNIKNDNIINNNNQNNNSNQNNKKTKKKRNRKKKNKQK